MATNWNKIASVVSFTTTIPSSSSQIGSGIGGFTGTQSLFVTSTTGAPTSGTITLGAGTLTYSGLTGGATPSYNNVNRVSGSHTIASGDVLYPLSAGSLSVTFGDLLVYSWGAQRTTGASYTTATIADGGATPVAHPSGIQSINVTSGMSWSKICGTADVSASPLTATVTTTGGGGQPNNSFVQIDQYRVSGSVAAGTDIYTAGTHASDVGFNPLSSVGSTQSTNTDELTWTSLYTGGSSNGGPSGTNDFVNTAIPATTNLTSNGGANTSHLFTQYAGGIQASATAGNNGWTNTWASPTISILFAYTFYYLTAGVGAAITANASGGAPNPTASTSVNPTAITANANATGVNPAATLGSVAAAGRANASGGALNPRATGESADVTYIWGMYGSSGGAGPLPPTPFSVPFLVPGLGSGNGGTAVQSLDGEAGWFMFVMNGVGYGIGQNYSNEIVQTPTNPVLTIQQLGAATDGGASPFPLGGATVVQLEGGDEWTVALDTTGLLWAFGQNDAGQLGNGTSTNNPVPTPVTVSGGASNFIGLAQYGSVSGGSNHCIALDSTGAVWGWGGNSNGQLGLGAAGGQRVHPNAVLPVGGGAGQLGVAPSPAVTLVSVGDHTSFCLMDGGMQVAAFGQNENGQCGTGSTPPNNITTPTLMSLTGLALPILAVSGGGGAGGNDGHTLVVDNNLMLWACGDNTYGQLGQGTTDTNPHPQLIPVFTSSGGVITGTQFQVLSPSLASAGGQHSMAVDQNGILWSWGNNFDTSATQNTLSGALGVGSSIHHTGIPQQVGLPTGATINMIWAGNNTSLADVSGGQPVGTAFAQTANANATGVQPAGPGGNATAGAAEPVTATAYSPIPIVSPGTPLVTATAYSPTVQATPPSFSGTPITLEEVWRSMIATIAGVQPFDSELRQLMLAFANAIAGQTTSVNASKLQGTQISSAPVTNGEVLEVVGGIWTPTPLPTIPTSLPPNGPAGGDLGLTYPNPTVVGIQTVPVNPTLPTSGEALVFNGANWEPELPVPDSGWVLITSFTGGWSNGTSPPGTPTAYRKIGNVVYLRGLMVGANSGDGAFQLPGGFVPVALQVFVGGTDAPTSHCVVSISSAGEVVPGYTGGPAYITLDGINFMVN